MWSQFSGESEKNLAKAFDSCIEQSANLIILLDEVDSFTTNRFGNSESGGHSRRILSTLLTSFDKCSHSQNIFIIGTTNDPSNLDPALRRSGRFDQEIQMPVPNRIARAEIIQNLIQAHSQYGIGFEDRFSVLELADRTIGFVGADLVALLSKSNSRFATSLGPVHRGETIEKNSKKQNFLKLIKKFF